MALSSGVEASESLQISEFPFENEIMFENHRTDLVMQYLGTISMQNEVYRPQFQWVSSCVSVSFTFPDARLHSRPTT